MFGICNPPSFLFKIDLEGSFNIWSSESFFVFIAIFGGYCSLPSALSSISFFPSELGLGMFPVVLAAI